jgi:hypothetical protein
MTKQVVKYTHHLKWELTYIVILAYMLILLDLRANHFKSHDRIQHRPIDFQSANLGTTQGDEHFCTYDVRCGFAQVSAHPWMTSGAYSQTHIRSANQCVQKVMGYRLTSCSILIIFTRAASCTKSKGLSIDISFYTYTFYTCNAMYKK